MRDQIMAAVEFQPWVLRLSPERSDLSISVKYFDAKRKGQA